MTAYDYISRRMTETELLAGLAEECAELGKAALKMRRVLDRSNPTPVTFSEARQAIVEEIADVEFLLEMLGYKSDGVKAEIKTIREEKTPRWAKRLGWKGNEKNGNKG